MEINDNLSRMYEQATEQEQHQFLAGVQRIIVLEDQNLRKLRKAKAEGQQKEELGEFDDEQRNCSI